MLAEGEPGSKEHTDLVVPARLFPNFASLAGETEPGGNLRFRCDIELTVFVRLSVVYMHELIA